MRLAPVLSVGQLRPPRVQYLVKVRGRHGSRKEPAEARGLSRAGMGLIPGRWGEGSSELPGEAAPSALSTGQRVSAEELAGPVPWKRVSPWAQGCETAAHVDERKSSDQVKQGHGLSGRAQQPASPPAPRLAGKDAPPRPFGSSQARAGLIRSTPPEMRVVDPAPGPLGKRQCPQQRAACSVSPAEGYGTCRAAGSRFKNHCIHPCWERALQAFPAACSRPEPPRNSKAQT